MGDPRLSVGTSGWSELDWVGPFYPRGTLPRDFLAVYAREFGAVKIDSTYYRIPPPKMVDAWNAATPKTFRFAPKVSQVITHEKRLENCAAELDTFLTAVRRLGPKLGPLVLQFDAGFRVDRLPVFAFANNRFQRHGPATARTLPARVTGAAPQP